MVLDLDTYFERIHHPLPTSPDFATLATVVRAHVEHIPFENLDVLLGRPISLDIDAIFEKLVLRRRGGYCFEQNTLFGAILEKLGYEVEYLSGRVRLQRAPEFTPARTHVFLLVRAADAPAHLIDVGVGGLSPTAPLPLRSRAILPTPHEPRRLLDEAAWLAQGGSHRPPSILTEQDEPLASTLSQPTRRWFHQAYFGNAWHDVVEFTGERMPVIDRTLANFFTSAHPDSHFKNRLMVARATPTGRLTLLNDRLTARTTSGESTESYLGTAEEVHRALQEHFNLRLEVMPPHFRSA